MTTYLLVHGAWHGGWCWSRVAGKLRSHGYEVFTPTLSGVGERSHRMTGDINLDTHIQDIVNVIRWEELGDIVLCGHSYAGMVITGVADAMPGSIRSLVYLDAFVPEDGESLWHFIPDEARAGTLDEVAANGGIAMSPIPAEAFKVNERDRAWVDRQCTLQPFATFRQNIRLTGAHRQVAKRIYIWAKSFEEGPFTPFYHRLKGDPAWIMHVLPCGHDVMLDMPDELTEILLSAA